MGFKMKSGNKPEFKKMGATEAIKQVDTSKNMDTEREIYKAKLRGDYQDLTGDKLKKASYDDPTGTVVSRDPHYLDSPNKQKVDPDAPGTPGEPGYEPPVKQEGLDDKGKKLWNALRKGTITPDLDRKINKIKNAKKKKSPAKAKGDNLKRIMSESKAAQKKAGTFYASGADPKVNKGSMPKGFNIKGSSKGDKFGKYQKGFESTKQRTQNFRDAAKKTKTVRSTQVSPSGKVFDALKKTPKKYVKPAKEILKTSTRNLVSGGKQVATTIGKVAAHPVTKVLGKVAAAVAVPATLYDFYKSGQKHSGGKAVKGQKSFMAESKKKTKSIYKKK